MAASDEIKTATEIVKTVGGLPAVVLALVLLFPQAVTGFVLWRLDATMQRLVAAVESRIPAAPTTAAAR